MIALAHQPGTGVARFWWYWYPLIVVPSSLLICWLLIYR